MTKKLEFKNAKKVLKRRCKTLITELTKASKTLIEGAKSEAKRAASDYVEKEFETASTGTSKVKLEVEIGSHGTGLQLFWSQTHGCLISEWHSFLTRVFKELVDYYLKNNKNEIVAKGLDIYLKDADFSTLPRLRDSISVVLVEKYASKTYPDRINRLKNILEINSSALEHEPEKLKEVDKFTAILQKHVAVRNCLEHADSKVRIRDLNAAGCGGKEIPLINADGTEHRFVEGNVIVVSDKDVVELKETILEFINYFEVKL
jgi:hypothetical protein